MSIAFQCEHCGKHYEVGDDLATRRARCSGCQAVFRVPEPVGMLHSPLGDEALLAALFEEEFGPAADDSKPCPSCSKPLAETDVLCIECVFHRERGHRIFIDRQEAEPAASIDSFSSATQTPTTTPSVTRTFVRQPKRHLSFRLASYVRGTLISLAFVLIGGVLWAFASLATDYSLGFLAWGVGSLAGLGMALGHQDNDGTLAGITSAMMALVGCVFSKVLYFAIFLSAFLGMSNHDMREYCARIMAEEQIRATGSNPQQADAEYYDQQYQLAVRKIQTWDSEKIQQRIQLHEDADRIELMDRLRAAQQLGPQGNAADNLAAYTEIGQRVALLSDAEVVTELENTPAVVATATIPTGTEDWKHADFDKVTLTGLILWGLLAFGIFGGVFLVLGVISAYRIGAGSLAA
ncbi:MAG: hypothetical protein VXZ84_01535 [Planctomycetota bacterium]|nr:hypothetical protein [Planctomycetota bacterium]